MPSAGLRAVPSSSAIFCVALWVEKQYCGRPRRQDRQLPHTARQFSTTKSPGETDGDVGTDRFDHAGSLVAEEERELVVDAALPVVEVGVADTARLDPDERLAGAGVGYDDGADLDRVLHLHGDDGAYLVRHEPGR